MAEQCWAPRGSFRNGLPWGILAAMPPELKDVPVESQAPQAFGWGLSGVAWGLAIIGLLGLLMYPVLLLKGNPPPPGVPDTRALRGRPGSPRP